jgi:hypothetical protein
MNELTQIEHLAAMAREHQAEMLRAAQSDDQHASWLSRWRNGLLVLVLLGVPVAYFLVRVW